MGNMPSTESNSLPSEKPPVKPQLDYIEFMTGGGCKESSIAFMDCLREAEEKKEDDNTKCAEVHSTLYKCMKSHSDYYHPFVVDEESFIHGMAKELEIAFLGDSDQADAESEEERDLRLDRLCELMEGGACKESFKASGDCMEKKNGDDSSDECEEEFSTLLECMNAHSDYYPSFKAAFDATWKTTKEQMDKKLNALFGLEEQAEG